MALKDVTSVGILSASPALTWTIEDYASGGVDPREIVAATVGLDQVGEILAGAGERIPARAEDSYRSKNLNLSLVQVAESIKPLPK